MGDTNLESLELTELSLNTAPFVIALTELFIGFLIIYSEAPYTLINENPGIFQLIWISAALLVGFSLSAVILFLYARTIFLEAPGSARWIQKIGLGSFTLSIIAFLLSFYGLIWGYCSTTELLHFSTSGEKITTFLGLVLTVTYGFIIVLFHYLWRRFCVHRGSRSSDYDRLNP